jgi:hypothetical protein
MIGGFSGDKALLEKSNTCANISFGEDKTKIFWERILECNQNSEYPEDIIKYRFPILATSKTPDHAVGFGDGNNVEESTRGELALKPDYEDGFPNHRLAGLLYVTLHNLRDLHAGLEDGSIMDVNRSISLGEIKIPSATTASNLRNQQEVDFFGEMQGDVIAIIPILYPHIREGESFDKEYHQQIWGINPGARKDSIVNPSKIKEHLDKNPNPSLARNKVHSRIKCNRLYFD